MNFYLDFEATQFSERIISIGCVSENGNDFDTLVRPPKGDKVNAFITKLTGITQEMVEYAPSADESFLALREFIREESHGEETFFFVFGNADRHFIERTVSKMSNPEAKKFAYKLGASLIDFSEIVNRFFRVDSISLKKAVAYFRQEEVEQNHHAIDDAELLRELVYMINHCDMPTPEPEQKISKPAPAVKSTNGKVMTKLTFPSGYKDWAHVPRCWYPEGTILRCDKGGKVEKPFAAIEHTYGHIKAKHGMTIKNATIKKIILDAIANGTNAYGKKWVVV